MFSSAFQVCNLSYIESSKDLLVSIMRRRRDVQNMCFAFTQNLCLADTMVGFSIISVAVLSPPMKASDENMGLQDRICMYKLRKR